MTTNIFKFFPLLILFAFGGCNLLTADPVDQASEIVKTQLKSPSSFKKINGKIIWQGKNTEGMPSYVVSISFESANSFGASLRGCMFVTYSETADKKVTWNKDYGVKDFSEMLPLCEEATPMEIKQKMANTLVDINFNILKKETSSTSETAKTDQPTPSNSDKPKSNNDSEKLEVESVIVKKLQPNRDGSSDLIVDRVDFNQKDMNFTIAGDAPSKVSEFIEKNLGKKIKVSYVIRDGWGVSEFLCKRS
jgi:hypothetical protein